MSYEIKTILKVIAFFMLGFTLNYAMSIFAAPINNGTAILAGIFLTTFGIAIAKFSMELVILPLAAMSFIWRAITGAKPQDAVNRKRDLIDRFGRALFVLIYVLSSTLTGIYIGALSGGMGWFATAAMFCFAGTLIALLVPQDLIWGTDGGNATQGMSKAEKTDHQIARNKGDPTILFSDKIVKKVTGALGVTSNNDENKNGP